MRFLTNHKWKYIYAVNKTFIILHITNEENEYLPYHNVVVQVANQLRQFTKYVIFEFVSFKQFFNPVNKILL